MRTQGRQSRNVSRRVSAVNGRNENGKQAGMSQRQEQVVGR